MCANVHFEYVDSQDVTVRITFDPRGSSWSLVGRDILQAHPLSATMNLSCVEDTDDISDFEKGIVLHEFGHTLGLGREHQSPTRGGKIALKEEGESDQCGSSAFVANSYLQLRSTSFCKFSAMKQKFGKKYWTYTITETSQTTPK